MEKITFDSLTKSKLSEFNKAELQGWIIDQFQQLENRIDSKIIEYFQPNDKIKFEKIVLNSTIINNGGKLKILTNIGVKKTTIEKLRTVARIRNGFSHTRIRQNITIMISDNANNPEKNQILSESIIDVMNSNGKITSKSAYEWIIEFLTLRNELRKELN